MENTPEGHCCGRKMVETLDTFERICPSFGKLEQLDATVAAFPKEVKGWAPPLLLSTIFARPSKNAIFDDVNTVVIGGGDKCGPRREFDTLSGKSTNYICFLHDYFQTVPDEIWPRKRTILQCLSPAFWEIHPNTRFNAGASFLKWWWDSGGQTQTTVKREEYLF